MTDASSFYVCWSHGKESGPWGAKLTRMVEAARNLGFEADSLDYQGIYDPLERVDKLIRHCRTMDKILILAGSSMGGYVSAAAAETLQPAGLFLLAPALYLPGYPTDHIQISTPRITIIHGWRDEVIPPENSFRFAQRFRGDLHLIDGDHRLQENIPQLIDYYTLFLHGLIKDYP